jgi:hypothetical protein
MKRAITKLVLMAAIVAIVFSIPTARFGAAALPVVHAQVTDGGCSLASLTGRYAVGAAGTVVTQLPGLPAPPFPFGEVGIDTFNGMGSFSGQVTVNLGGMVVPVSVTGAYEIKADCTGTRRFNTSLGLVGHDAFVVTGGGREVIATETDPFAVVQRTLKRLDD